MKLFKCWDMHGDSVRIEADDAASAAQEYVSDGDYPTPDLLEQVGTYWVRVTAIEILGEDEDGEDVDGDRTTHMIPVDPSEPPCSYKRGHNFRQDSARGHGEGVVVVEVCHICGLEKITDTWAQCPVSGIQGLRSVRYDTKNYSKTAPDGSVLVEAAAVSSLDMPLPVGIKPGDLIFVDRAELVEALRRERAAYPSHWEGSEEDMTEWLECDRDEGSSLWADSTPQGDGEEATCERR